MDNSKRFVVVGLYGIRVCRKASDHVYTSRPADCQRAISAARRLGWRGKAIGRTVIGFEPRRERRMIEYRLARDAYGNTGIVAEEREPEDIMAEWPGGREDAD